MKAMSDWGQRSSPDYAKFRFALLQRVLNESLLPVQVADILEAERPKFPQIQRSEIETYRSWNDVWDFYPGTHDYGRPLSEEAKEKTRARLRAGTSPWPCPLEIQAAERMRTCPGVLSIPECEMVMAQNLPAAAEAAEKAGTLSRLPYPKDIPNEAWFATEQGQRALKAWNVRAGKGVGG